MNTPTPLSEEIRQSFDFIHIHLGKIESDLTVITTEIKEIKEKLRLTDRGEQELIQKYTNLSDNCKRALAGLAVVMGDLKEE